LTQPRVNGNRTDNLNPHIGRTHPTRRAGSSQLPRGDLVIANLVVWLIVGLIAGYLASKVLRGKGMGLPMDVVVGLLGAMLGGFLAGIAGISFGGFLSEVIVAFVGAILLLLAVRLVLPGGRFSRR